MIQKSLHKATLLLSLLLCSFVSAKSSDRITRASTGASCATDTLNVGVQVYPAEDYIINYPTLNTDGGLTGQPIVIYCELAKRLGKNLNFIGLDPSLSGAQIAALIVDGTIDMSVLPVRDTTLNSANIGIVVTDASFDNTVPLAFNQATPVADSVPALLAINPNTVFGSSGPGTTSYQSLIEYGVSPSNIIDVSQAPANNVAQIQALFTTYGVGALYGLTTCGEYATLTAETPGVISYVCLNMQEDLSYWGVGIAINAACCSLINQVQSALNDMIADGTYADLPRQMLQQPYWAAGIQQYGLDSIVGGSLGIPNVSDAFWIPQPYPNYSLEALTPGSVPFVPLTCLATVPANAADSNALVNAIKAKYCNSSCNYSYTPFAS